MQQTQIRPAWLWAGAAAAVGMVIGGFGPWATALGFISVAGTHGDGWFVILAGAAGGGLLAHAALAAAAQWKAIVAAILGGVGAVTTLIDLTDLSGNSVDFFGQDVNVVSPAWGIYLALVASLAMIAAGVWAAIRSGH